jgi:hypothetical protein
LSSCSRGRASKRSTRCERRREGQRSRSSSAALRECVIMRAPRKKNLSPLRGGRKERHLREQLYHRRQRRNRESVMESAVLRERASRSNYEMRSLWDGLRNIVQPRSPQSGFCRIQGTFVEVMRLLMLAWFVNCLLLVLERGILLWGDCLDNSSDDGISRSDADSKTAALCICAGINFCVFAVQFEMLR